MKERLKVIIVVMAVGDGLAAVLSDSNMTDDPSDLTVSNVQAILEVLEQCLIG